MTKPFTPTDSLQHGKQDPAHRQVNARASLAGPNPYPVYSFLELRKVMGRPYVVCLPCRRFVPIGAWLDRRDTRTTTFSCSVCGGDGDVVLEDPAKEGLQHDPRPKPIRHRLAALRLRALHALNDPFRHKASARDAAPAQQTLPGTVPSLSPGAAADSDFPAGVRFRLGVAHSLPAVPRLLRGEIEAAREKPAAIVLSFIADDVRRMEMKRVWGAEKPYFTVVDGKLVERNVPVPPSPDPATTLDAWNIAFGRSVLVKTVGRGDGAQRAGLVVGAAVVHHADGAS